MLGQQAHVGDALGGYPSYYLQNVIGKGELAEANMSEADKDRWNQRYLDGAYSTRLAPGVLVEQWAPRLFAELAHAPRRPVKRALDVACGAGRNALYLTELGFEVTGVDISSAALQRASAQANKHPQAKQQTPVHWCELDLDQPLPTTPPFAEPFDLIIVVRYADLELTEALIDRLAPGGVLLVEAHLGGPLFAAAESPLGGPGSERFRLSPGALAASCAQLHKLYANEGLVTDPDGTLMALSQFVGRRD